MYEVLMGPTLVAGATVMDSGERNALESLMLQLTSTQPFYDATDFREASPLPFGF